MIELEEDIKILEEFLSKTDVDYAEYFNCTKSLIPDTVEIAIKNILSNYKQLEEETKELKEAYKSEKTMKNNYVRYYQDLLLKENCIPKSKVKEKIEGLNNRLEQCEEDAIISKAMFEGGIEVCKELLGEEQQWS